MTINIHKFKKFQPFLKWVGGKRALLPEILKQIPTNFNNYFEPFVGGGALFFELKKLGLLDGKSVYLFDKNAELVNTYKIVRDNPSELLIVLNDFQKSHTEEFYYQIREMDRNENFKTINPILRAARFIYLNKTCFNGLYRVNSKGFFNVPMGKYKNPSICNSELIYDASYALKNTIIENYDFAEILNFANEKDFAYFDPPYYPLTTTSSFTSYNQDAFLDDEQRRLFEVFKKLHSKNMYVLHSNSDTDFIKNLYSEFEIEIVECPRFINSKSEGRGKIKEVLIRG